MRIRRISFTDHPVLGTLTLDFTSQATGLAASAIVLAGENGTGKTVLLNEIFRLLADPDFSRGLGIIEAELEVPTAEQPTAEQLGWGPIFPSPPLVNGRWDGNVTLRLDRTRGGAWRDFNVTTSNSGGTSTTSASSIFNLTRERPLKVYFSEAGISYDPQQINSIGVSILDNGEITSKRSGENVAREVAQLLVDIRAADAEDLQVWVEQNVGQVPPEAGVGTRMRRFKDAMAYMFPSKRLVSRRADDGRQVSIEFEEGGRSSSLAELSSGEKQIVFRGGFLLKDLTVMQGGVILIDEPEISLHPAWQARILGFYENLFPDHAGSTSQLILATHSPFLVHDQSSAKVIVLSKDVVGRVYVAGDPTFAGTGQSQVINAFNVASLIPRSQLPIVVLVEGESDVRILENAWRKLRSGQPPVAEFRAAFSDAAIRTVLNDTQTFAKSPGKKIVGLFDFDGAFDQWNGVWRRDGVDLGRNERSGVVRKHATQTAWSMLLPVPTSRTPLASLAMGSRSALSIEMLFADSNHLPGMIRQDPLPSIGATVPKMVDSMKMAFARHTDALPPSAFDEFRELIATIDDIAGGRL